MSLHCLQTTDFLQIQKRTPGKKSWSVNHTLGIHYKIGFAGEKRPLLLGFHRAHIIIHTQKVNIIQIKANMTYSHTLKKV